jgi:hypothetical protein
MSCYKIILATAAIIFILPIANVEKTIAGEKQRIQTHDLSYKTKIHKLDVGDDEGHVLVIFENKSNFQGDIADENIPESSVGFLDINPKTGKMLGKGYVINIDKDGDKLIQEWEGKSLAKNDWKGTWAIIKCTGKYEGAEARGTWTSHNLTLQQGKIEVNVELDNFRNGFLEFIDTYEAKSVNGNGVGSR